jgi:hypothetical protein
VRRAKYGKGLGETHVTAVAIGEQRTIVAQ